MHLDPPFKHARHYTGYTPDKTVKRRVEEHLTGGPKGSPLIRAAMKAGCKVTLAKEFKGQGRDFERWIKARKDIRRWCPCCGLKTKPIPKPENMSQAFKDGKKHYPRTPIVCEEYDDAIPF